MDLAAKLEKAKADLAAKEALARAEEEKAELAAKEAGQGGKGKGGAGGQGVAGQGGKGKGGPDGQAQRAKAEKEKADLAAKAALARVEKEKADLAAKAEMARAELAKALIEGVRSAQRARGPWRKGILFLSDQSPPLLGRHSRFLRRQRMPRRHDLAERGRRGRGHGYLADRRSPGCQARDLQVDPPPPEQNYRSQRGGCTAQDSPLLAQIAIDHHLPAAGLRAGGQPSRAPPSTSWTTGSRITAGFALLKDKTIWFRLIPKKKGPRTTQPTFYIMQDKVSLGQFRKFAAVQKNRISKDRKWEANTAAKDDWPALNVKGEDAYKFAQWLSERNGHLPSVEQWDKAAGAYENPLPGEGPYQGKWAERKKLKDPGIAIGRRLNPPRPLHETTGDVSAPYGCRNMAGNGYEWTRTLAFGGRHVQPPPAELKDTDRVILRGSWWGNESPLRYSDLIEDLQPSSSYRDPAPETRPKIGFRVVMETEP